jgi:hypothetical protein
MRHTRLYRQGMLEAKDFPAAQISDFLEQPDTVVWLDLCEPDQVDLELVSEEFGLHRWRSRTPSWSTSGPNWTVTRTTTSSPPTPLALTRPPADSRKASWPRSSPPGR